MRGARAGQSTTPAVAPEEEGMSLALGIAGVGYNSHREHFFVTRMVSHVSLCCREQMCELVCFTLGNNIHSTTYRLEGGD